MIKDIYATWGRTESRRYVIAHISRTNDNKLSFSYNRNGLYEAQKEGLEYFVGFRKNADKISSERIEDILSLRVISDKRPDRMELLNFWEVPQFTDKIDILAFTQGKSPTDFYEYIPDFTTYTEKSFTFVTDLIEVEKLNLTANEVKIGDKLKLLILSNGVSVINYKNEIVGKIKIIHELPFIAGFRANLTVKAIYMSHSNVIKRIFVKVDVIDNTVRFEHFLQKKYESIRDDNFFFDKAQRNYA